MLCSVCSQKPTIGSYFDPVESILYYHLCLVPLVVYSLQTFKLKFYINFSSTMPHVSPTLKTCVILAIISKSEAVAVVSCIFFKPLAPMPTASGFKIVITQGRLLCQKYNSVLKMKYFAW